MLHQLISHYVNSANAANARGEYTVAEGWCKQALQLAPDLPEAWYNLGVALSGLSKRAEAMDALEKARIRTLNSPDAQNSIGLQFIELRAEAEAEKCLQLAISLAPQYAFAHSNLGKLRQQQRRLDEAERYFQTAIGLQPQFAPLYVNLCAVYIEKKEYKDAEVVCRKAIEFDPGLPQAWSNLGAILVGLKRHEDAEAACRKAIELAPHLSEAWGNLGEALNKQHRYEVAEAACRKAIELAPTSAEAWGSLGVVFQTRMNPAAAEDAYRKALALDPTSPEAWRHLGCALEAVKQLKLAADCYSKSYELNPDAEFALGQMLHTKLAICEWDGFDNALPVVTENIIQGRASAGPFEVIALTSDLAIQHQTAIIHSVRQHPAQSLLGPIPPQRARRAKIRLGYYSADFQTHPVGLLACELFETHDTSKFELIGFSFGPGESDQLRQRIAGAFNQFIDVRNKSDREVAQLSRELGIDIAITLGGYTIYNRTDIFAMRAAPIQVSYLGYPGTMGADYIDYLIADKIVCPESSQAHYTEKMAYLPHCFMPHDSTQEISSKTITRQEFALPETGFVFCCFNNHYKINPRVFDVWMRLLKNVEGSVLWLSDGSQTVKDNLGKEAAARGVDPMRLVFARRLDSMAEHLARYRLADLFIDTLPYNAHATACDALWAGVPVLTCPGETFASRVAASLLTAIDLPELIASNQADYEALAIGLATNPERLQQLKQKLQRNRLTTALFNTPLLTRHIEAVYSVMNERYQKDLPTENIDVSQ